MCAIYPWQSPGGWHLIGRTPVRPFDLGRANGPALFAPGDEVRLVAIDGDEYARLDDAAAAGRLPDGDLFERSAW